jgi:putative alpha-1,2-mannosidase
MGGVSALMSMGIFSLTGNNSLNPIYEITSPVFDRVVIHLDDTYYSGKTFEIVTKHNSRENVYIQKAVLNNKELSGPWFSHAEFAKGGKLEIELGPEPNKSWGTNIEDLIEEMNRSK